jgi:beta-keto acid cleavage enzyme
LIERGIGVEAGLWHREGVAAWLGSPHRDQCVRVLIELPDGLDEERTVAEAALLLRLVRDGVHGQSAASTPVLLHGEGSSCWPALRLAVRRSLDIRIGLEDTLDLPDGSLAPDNAALVRAARLIAATRLHD